MHKMRERKFSSLCVVFATFICVSYGCQVVDHNNWNSPIITNIYDILEAGETVVRRDVINIEGFSSIGFPTAMVGGPYFDVTLENSELVVRTNAAYPGYEEVEVLERVVITIIFSCTGGTTSPALFIWVDITDTNNNPPEFKPTNEFEFVVTPPLPPGFLITGCLNDVIIVRDIDLTTQRIDFTIEDNPYFEIYYDQAATSVAKEFGAQLRTKTFVRSLSEPLRLTITATDVDLTNDRALTTAGTVRIVADSEFQFPEELVFDQTFYLANYTDDHQLNLLETISLRQGFDEYVIFTLEGEYYDRFDLKDDDNQVTLEVLEPLSNEVWSEKQILLIVRAEREFTSGASTTVIVQLPEVIELQFERVLYEGVIENNVLQLAPLALSQGYEGVTVSAEAVGEHSSHFTAAVQSNLVTLTMTSLIDDVIDNNSFISIQVVASSDHSSATTVVNLEIIKEDGNTPVFEKSIYSGSYDPATGFTVEEIRFVQGFDDTVTVDLFGDDADYFEIVESGPVVKIVSSTIPPEMFSQGHVFITIEAKKPRTVGANAVIHVALPAARELKFEESTYRGTTDGSSLTVPTILLHQGYEEGVSFNLSGEYSTSFDVTNERDEVIIVLSSFLPDIAIAENSVIVLALTASGLNAITTTTSVFLEVIKEDTITPVFRKPIYYGTYSGGAIDIELIDLTQGFDSTVSFRIDGEHAQYFTVNENNAVISLQSTIPEDLIFNEKVLHFNVLADKALTVGANAAVLIRFPSELTESAIMRFSRHTYYGTLEENEFNVDEIVLDTGFAPGTEFIISEDFKDHFFPSNTNNVIHISSLNTLPNEVLEENDFIVLELEARRPRAVSVWTSVVVDIVKKEVIAPVFGQAYYTGAYTEEAGLTFEETINLAEGFDETVTFALSGESEAWFSIEQEGSTNSLTLVPRIPVPADILESNNQLLFTIVANKPNATSGHAVISLDLPKAFPDEPLLLGFDRVTYSGSIENNQANIPAITLSDGFREDVEFSLHGELRDYFSLTPDRAVVTVTLQTSIPEQLIPANRIIVLEIQASAPQAVPAHATIVVQYVVDDNIGPVVELIFAQTFYSGSYAVATGLSFPTPISLTQGYDPNVDFALEGDDAGWFDLVQNGNSVTVILISPIPPAVIANNQQLVFVATAQSPGSATARATVVITLADSFPDEPLMLGFDRVTYSGSIENNQANIPAITLSEGFREDVEFSLHGELRDYFSLTPDRAVVTVTLQTSIPEQLIPANRIIVLEIQASAPQAVPAHATIVVQYVVDDNIGPVVELIFAQTFYSGSYAVATGLSFPTPISLTQGYDPNVDFALEGDDAGWFDLVQNGNSVTVILISPIPPAVIANNQQLVFVATAQSPGSATARATVVITLADSFPDEPLMLGFDRVTYSGSIENNQANIPAITLSEGFREDVEFSLHGELRDYFSLTPDRAVVTVTLQTSIPEQLIPANRIIVLEIQASAPQAVPAHATIVVQYVVDDNIGPVVELIFAQTFYSGSYAVATGLSFPTPISLTQGYDPNVDFALEGDDAGWFDLVQNGNSVTVILISPIPPAVIANNQQLVFVATAQSPGSATARATVVITLADSFPDEPLMLGFDRVTYSGSIENNQANIPAITLSEGFREDVEFSLHGELRDYFSLTPDRAVVTVTLQTSIPEQLIPANRIIVLEIQASAPQAVPAHATIVVQYVVDDNIGPVVELIFAQTFYSGSYAVATGLSFPTPISLTQGYDPNVDFALEGDDAGWFDLVQNGNSVTVILISPIPPAVIANNQQLVFVATAQSPGSATARATVVITLADSFPDEPLMLGFDRVTYSGSIENNQANIPAITLSEGFREDVEFSLHGELRDYFSLTPDRAVVTVTLQTSIPEQLIPANRIIVLEIQASAPQAVPAHATIVVQYVVDDNIGPVVELIFAQTFYSGSYAVATGLSFPTPISLTQGYDPNVDFALEGDDAGWFDLVQNGNSVTVILISPIPPAVIANNQQLVFVATAQSPGSATARATIVITLADSFPDEPLMLGFDRVTYSGSIENNQANIPAITLSEGFREDVEFSLHGELRDYFSLTPDRAVVTVTLQTSIPEQLIPANRIIVLEIQASAPQAVPAHATIVVQYVVDDNIGPVVELIFAQTFYSGSYAVATGLSFPTPISLTQGYDPNVDFALEGDDAGWFDLVQNGNSVTVILISPIPPAVIANNQQLVFVATAQSPGSATARATVVITLADSFPDEPLMLGFDRVTYSGSIENNQANIPAITLSEGFREDVEFSLHGELRDYFSLTPDRAVVTVTLQTSIPEQLIPANRIIVLEIQASAPQAVPAHATIVVQYVVDDNIGPVVELIFAQTFYSGSYAVATGLSFPTPISLTQGYDPNVDFALEGDDAGWFDLVQNGNSVTVILISPIPPAVIANNQQLVFVATAQSPGSATARATIVITLADSFPDEPLMLGFDRVTYSGSIENNQANIPAITLSEGFREDVEFSLHGELRDYFSLTPDRAVVTVTLQTSIPEQLIPANRIIVLEIQASAPQAVPAHATIVVQYVVDDNIGPVVELIFAQTFYSGSYAVTTGLSFPTPISLTQGYDPNVDFALEGDDAGWFDLVQNGNSVTVILISPIPPAVIANNQQLVFVATAQSPGSATARATVVITLADSFPDEPLMLGFDRVTYSGSIENNQANIPAITLSEGFREDVEFSLHGELRDYFSLTPDRAVVTVTLQTSIPEQLIPANRIIVLEIQASAPQAVPAHATIVVQYVVDDNIGPVVELIFAQTFYSGSYAVTTGLSFPTPISLTQGYDPNVDFALEGDDAGWFDLVQNGNSVTVILISPIPPAVIANNQQLVFVATAHSPGSATARATVVITLADSFPDEPLMLGFDRVTYSGSIENNQANIPAITLSEGFREDVEFSLHGELRDYFSLTPDRAVVTVTLQTSIPEQLIPANRIIVLEIQASAPQAVPAHATIVVQYVVDDNIGPVVELIFAQTFYSGSYAVATGLSFPTPISLTQGYDPNVDFALEGDDAGWFDLVQNGNSVTVILISPIPPAVIANNQQLVFVATAQSPGSATARATVVITLADSFPDEPLMLGFDRVTYSGSIENNQANIPAITLSEGFREDVEFSLHGELRDYFSLTPDRAVVTVTLQTSIPEQLIPANRIIVLEIQASAPQAVPAHATIVVQYVVDDNIGPVVELIFAQTFYSGSYAVATGLSFPTPISLTQGYDPNVDFALEGDDAGWFDLVQNGNSVTVILISPIPPAVIANNQQLVFVATAQSPGSATARATIVITLADSFPDEPLMLGFDRVTYSGSIENNQANIPAITLSEGFREDVEFSLHGELRDYFSLTPDRAVVTVTLQTSIPEQLIPANRIIVLEIQASAPQAVPAHATIVVQYVVDDNIGPVVELIFAQTFYSGSYAVATGLSFPTPISLTQGYDPNVDFALEGDDAGWFDLVQNGNSVTVILISPIPPAVIANNQQLVFVATAQSPGSATARATVVITLADSFPDEPLMLGFDRVTYSGSIENNQANIPAITLSEGFREDVEFSLHGELRDYFSLTPDRAVVTVTLQTSIPEQLIPANRIIVLEIQASAPQAVPAHATIVVQYVVDDNIGPVVELIFAQTFYSGSYAVATGLSFPTPISLTQGYDPNVDFALEGDDAGWFDLVQNGNSVTVILISPIPPAVIANNQQLVFVATAQSPGSATARATIVITLADSFPDEPLMLGFDRVTYSGSIENNQANIPAITLSEGFREDVEFSLHGELRDYFSLTPDRAVVTVTLQTSIPEQLIPANRIIVLEIQASAPQAVPAHATIVVQYVVDDNIGPVVELIFAQTFYSGSYAVATGLSFPTPISLTQGYDPNVDFALEGDDAGWFDLVQNGNSVTVILISPIPPAVIANNQQLVFVATAQSPGSATARATVVITLADSFPDEPLMLGFDRVTYSGSIENNQANIPAITLSEGFREDVEFSLHGELRDYFSLTPDRAVVTVTLQTSIPEQLIPANRIIVLEIQASAPQAVPAHATIVVQYVVGDNIGPVVELIFAQTFYSGSYAVATGLSFPTPISLTQGYDPNVDFALEGDDAGWFDLVQNGNSVTVILISPIPPAVIANNQQLVFVATAQSPGSATARATVVITLADSFPDEPLMLGFDRVTYSGSIENNQANIPAITLSEGFREDVEFSLHGELRDYFSLTPDRAVVTVTLQTSIPEQLIPANRIIVLEIQASAPQAVPAHATIVVQYVVDDNIGPVVELIFAQTFYSGSYAVATGLSFPTPISLTQGYDPNVDFALEGDDAGWFDLVQNGNSVTVILISSIPPAVIANNQQLVFVVTAQSTGGATARAVIVISLPDDALPTPTVTFTSPSYAVRVDTSQMDLVGQVQASADNGEDVTYSLQVDDAHLQERLSINGEGELHLSAPLNSGFYTFEVEATTVLTQIRGTAVVHISVEGVAICGHELVIDPLIVLDVDEEEPHHDLLNGTQYNNCHYTLTNRWPLDQTWVYVDETGLHTTAIDREHESIAFMALSQVQVEVILHCEGDSTRIKRSLASDALGPYDYGSNKWILTDTILYDSRRSLVNIIVNDINDNVPIFVGKENEPIAVGYPVPELAERVLPRSLAELQATDADIGENAALLYWSSATELAVAPSTGFVHLRDGATLQNGARLTVSATDRNGEGLTGSIDILVRLLDESYIAVVTIRDAFLDDEETVLSTLSEAVGYEIKVLRSVVISDEIESEVSRKKRDVSSAAGASLQLYVYGLIAREPVSVEQLTADMSNIVTATVTVASSVSLEDHLEGQEICVIAGRDTGLLVATIVLSVLLFIVLVLIAVWFFLRWRKNRNYDEFSDENSFASRNVSEELPKPEVLPKPTLDIAELKRSERRLQEMLDAPIEEISVEPTSSRNDAILNMPEQTTRGSRNDAILKMPEPMTPIVIQSIDKLKDAEDESSEDEFGETKIPMRKSVVTFNEKVEKIIHVEDTPDTEDLSSESNYEVYKL